MVRLTPDSKLKVCVRPVIAMLEPVKPCSVRFSPSKIFGLGCAMVPSFSNLISSNHNTYPPSSPAKDAPSANQNNPVSLNNLEASGMGIVYFFQLVLISKSLSVTMCSLFVSPEIPKPIASIVAD